jgi:flagellar basal body-associated protein FliL
MMSGSKHVGKAIDHRKSSRKKAWIICILVIIFLVILGVMLYVFWIQPTFLAAKQVEGISATIKNSTSSS